MSNGTDLEPKQTPIYVTQGTVQIELRPGHNAVFINPVHGFNVKHVEKEYIVFLPEYAFKTDGLKDQGCKALVFAKTQSFLVGGDVVSQLTDAAFKGTKVEIGLMTEELSKPEIASIKIPATF